MVNQVVDKLEEVFQSALLDNTMTDDHFLGYWNYLDVGLVETTNLIKDSQPNTSWYVPLFVSSKMRTQTTEPNFLEL